MVQALGMVINQFKTNVRYICLRKWFESILIVKSSPRFGGVFFFSFFSVLNPQRSTPLPSGAPGLITLIIMLVDRPEVFNL